jgi:hypothetical protein
MRETAREILTKPNVTDEERHAWLSEATANELSEFLRWAKADGSWALHGRDALNIVLARENISLQTDIRDMTARLKTMTKWLTGLTIAVTFLTFIQAYPIAKTLYSDIKTFLYERTTSQSTNTSKLQDKKNGPLGRTEVPNHK